MRADRLVSLVLLLRQRGRLSATALARELEVSTRTVLRDIEALSAAGVPVYAERGRHGGFALLPGFRTELTGLNHDEALALLVAGSRRGAQAFGLGSALASAMLKVVDALPESHRDTAAGAAERLLIDPETDLLSRRLVAEEVPDADRGRGPARGVRRAQAAHPLRGGGPGPRSGARSTRSAWSPYATRATCWPRGPARTAPTGCPGSWPPRNSPNPRSDRTGSTWTGPGRNAAHGSGPAATRSPCWYGWTRRGGRTWWAPRWPSAPRRPTPDGWLRLEVTFQDARHAEWALWQLAADAEALAPQWLRTALRDRAAAIAARYGTSTR